MKILLYSDCLTGFISNTWNKNTQKQWQKLVDSITKNAADAWQAREPGATMVRFLQRMSERPLKFRFLTVKEENGKLVVCRQ